MACTVNRIQSLPGVQSNLMAIVDSVDTSGPYTAVFKLGIAFATFDGCQLLHVHPAVRTSGPFDLAQTAIGTGPFIQAMLGIGALHGPRPRPRPACRCGASNNGLYEGKHYGLARTLNSPQPATRLRI